MVVFRAFSRRVTQLESNVVKLVFLSSYPAHLALHLVFISAVVRINEDVGGHEFKIGGDGEDVDIVNEVTPPTSSMSAAKA